MFVGRDGEDLKEVKKVPCLAICEGESGSKRAFLLLYCDKDWKVIATCPYDSTEAAMRHAERMYPGISDVWLKANVTKKQARDYLNKLWNHSRCYFCNHVKPGPAEITWLIKTKEGIGICNHCVDTFYRSIHARKARKRSGDSLPRKN